MRQGAGLDAAIGKNAQAAWSVTIFPILRVIPVGEPLRLPISNGKNHFPFRAPVGMREVGSFGRGANKSCEP
jgi:hypothetical protein